MNRIRLKCSAMDDTTEHSFTCPFCWEPITMVLDLTVETQSFIEDCEVCCHAIQIRYATSEGTLTEFEAVPAY